MQNLVVKHNSPLVFLIQEIKMRAKIISATSKIELSELPDGEYEGTWGGYVINATVNGMSVRFKTKWGIRGVNIPCVVIVNNGSVIVEEKQND